jgi:hypothetical protein
MKVLPNEIKKTMIEVSDYKLMLLFYWIYFLFNCRRVSLVGYSKKQYQN